MEIGYWLSSEEHAPRDLVEHAILAEHGGFEHVLISEHIHPRVVEPGHSPFVWSVTGAIAQATRRIRLGTAVTRDRFYAGEERLFCLTRGRWPRRAS